MIGPDEFLSVLEDYYWKQKIAITPSTPGFLTLASQRKGDTLKKKKQQNRYDLTNAAKTWKEEICKVILQGRSYVCEIYNK